METKKWYNQPEITVQVMEADVILLSENPSVEDVPWSVGGNAGGEEI